MLYGGSALASVRPDGRNAEQEALLHLFRAAAAATAAAGSQEAQRDATGQAVVSDRCLLIMFWRVGVPPNQHEEGMPSSIHLGRTPTGHISADSFCDWAAGASSSSDREHKRKALLRRFACRLRDGEVTFELREDPTSPRMLSGLPSLLRWGYFVDDGLQTFSTDFEASRWQLGRGKLGMILALVSWGLYGLTDILSAESMPDVTFLDIWAVRLVFLPPYLICLSSFFCCQSLGHHTQQTLISVAIIIVAMAGCTVGALFFDSKKISTIMALLSASYLAVMPALPYFLFTCLLLNSGQITREALAGVTGVDLTSHICEYFASGALCFTALIEIQKVKSNRIASLMIKEMRHLECARDEDIESLIERARAIFHSPEAVFRMVQDEFDDTVQDKPHASMFSMSACFAAVGDDTPFNSSVEEARYWEEDQSHALAFAMTVIPQLILTEAVLGVFDIIQLPGGEALVIAKYAVAIPYMFSIYAAISFLPSARAHTRPLLLSCFTVTTLAIIVAYELFVDLPKSPDSVTTDDVMRATETHFQIIVLWLGFWTDTRTTMREVAVPYIGTCVVLIVLHSHLQQNGVPLSALDFTVVDTVKNFIIVGIIGAILTRFSHRSRRLAFVLQTIMNRDAALSASRQLPRQNTRMVSRLSMEATPVVAEKALICHESDMNLSSLRRLPPLADVTATGDYKAAKLRKANGEVEALQKN